MSPSRYSTSPWSASTSASGACDSCTVASTVPSYSALADVETVGESSSVDGAAALACPTVAVATRSEATRARAKRWVGPDSGTRLGNPTPRTALRISISTQTVNCNHASQTIQQHADELLGADGGGEIVAGRPGRGHRRRSAENDQR